MSCYLLDTNALSETARPRPSAQLVARVQTHRADLCTSSVVWHGLCYGVSSVAPEERARLERVGRVMAFGDAQIAAVARVNDLVLVTANRADFEGFAGSRVESWMVEGAV